MTKEEILEKETDGIFDYHEGGITGIHNAMDIFAQQECIEISKWIAHTSEWVYLPSKKLWYNEEDEENITPINDNQLYQLYLQSKENKQQP